VNKRERAPQLNKNGEPHHGRSITVRTVSFKRRECVVREPNRVPELEARAGHARD